MGFAFIMNAKVWSVSVATRVLGTIGLIGFICNRCTSVRCSPGAAWQRNGPKNVSEGKELPTVVSQSEPFHHSVVKSLGKRVKMILFAKSSSSSSSPPAAVGFFSWHQQHAKWVAEKPTTGKNSAHGKTPFPRSVVYTLWISPKDNRSCASYHLSSSPTTRLEKPRVRELLVIYGFTMDCLWFIGTGRLVNGSFIVFWSEREREGEKARKLLNTSHRFCIYARTKCCLPYGCDISSRSISIMIDYGSINWME